MQHWQVKTECMEHFNSLGPIQQVDPCKFFIFDLYLNLDCLEQSNYLCYKLTSFKSHFQYHLFELQHWYVKTQSVFMSKVLCYDSIG